jgi:ankyrin repeat protein
MGAASGSGTFNVAFTANNVTNLYGYAHDVEVADFDHDGLSDYVVAMGSQNQTTTQAGQIFHVCRSNGTGGCVAVESGGMDLPLYHGITAADFDDDGLTDLVSTSRTGQRLPFLMIGRYRNTSQ